MIHSTQRNKRINKHNQAVNSSSYHPDYSNYPSTSFMAIRLSVMRLRHIDIFSLCMTIRVIAPTHSHDFQCFDFRLLLGHLIEYLILSSLTQFKRAIFDVSRDLVLIQRRTEQLHTHPIKLQISVSGQWCLVDERELKRNTLNAWETSMKLQMQFRSQKIDTLGGHKLRYRSCKLKYESSRKFWMRKITKVHRKETSKTASASKWERNVCMEVSECESKIMQIWMENVYFSVFLMTKLITFINIFFILQILRRVRSTSKNLNSRHRRRFVVVNASKKHTKTR